VDSTLDLKSEIKNAEVIFKNISSNSLAKVYLASKNFDDSSLKQFLDG
jgi:hypothetical protein